jgi:hypothetical protein
VVTWVVANAGSRGDVVGRERRFASLVVNGETHPVEAHQAFLRAEPDVAVMCLHDRRDGILRQAIIAVPHQMDVLGDRLARIERVGVGGQGQNQRDNDGERSCHGSHALCKPAAVVDAPNRHIPGAFLRADGRAQLFACGRTHPHTPFSTQRSLDERS